jgi:hypothetical protein
MANTIFIPPGGFAGFAQQTVAVQSALSRRAKPKRRARTTRKSPVRRKKTVARKRRAAPASRKRARASSRPARLVKGSAAAKRYMAKIRKMRK